jgi:hypothetical protein
MMGGHPNTPFGVAVCNMLGLGPVKGFAAMSKAMINMAFGGYLPGELKNKDAILNLFNNFNQNVKNECPKEKLLVYEVSQGWEPLCTFLGKPIPNVPFPHVNDTNEFKERIAHVNKIGWTVTSIFVVLVAIGTTLIYRNI